MAAQDHVTAAPRSTAPSRLRLAITGVAAVGLSLGLLELLAGLFDGVPSVVTAVGEVFIPITPPWLEDFGIEVFGTNDKTVLQAGIVVVTLGVGAWAGVSAGRSWRAGMTIFGAFTVVGAAAMLMQTMVDIALVLVAMGVAAGLGILALRRLVGAAGVDVDAASATQSARPLTDVDRRRFLAAAGTVAAAGAFAGAGGRSLQRGLRVEISEVTLPSATDTVPAVAPANDLSVPSLSPIITPNDDFYKIDTELGVPEIRPDDWTLTIRGMVDNELTLSFEQLLERPMMERYVTIACVSNEVGDDLVGNAKWLGTPLADLLNEAGVQQGASQIVGRAVGGWTSGFPTELAFDGRDAMVAVGMNGEPLPVDHGFPARLIIPGLYGYVSATKWLREIELTTWDGFDAYWVPRGWAKEGPIKTQSRIDVPRAGRSVTAGANDVAGVAWSPTRGIQRVEVQVDEEDWHEAVLSEPLSDDAWVQWRLQAELAPGSHRLRVRATDGTGETQTSDLVPPRPDGATGWHTISVTAA